MVFVICGRLSGVIEDAIVGSVAYWRGFMILNNATIMYKEYNTFLLKDIVQR